MNISKAMTAAGTIILFLAFFASIVVANSEPVDGVACPDDVVVDAEKVTTPAQPGMLLAAPTHQAFGKIHSALYLRWLDNGKKPIGKNARFSVEQCGGSSSQFLFDVEVPVAYTEATDWPLDEQDLFAEMAVTDASELGLKQLRIWCAWQTDYRPDTKACEALN